jgi:excisionase family DNA binding protein
LTSLSGVANIANVLKESRPKPLFLKISEVAALVGVSYATAWKLTNRGDWPSVTIGEHRRIPAAFVDELIVQAYAPRGAA